MISSEKIGLFGGSFDPIHHGHLILARDAMESLGLDRVV
ncbi:MAG: adenylyltransferase/cytidyltransferase family protein, partial [Spartobacteria bacterium]